MANPPSNPDVPEPVAAEQSLNGNAPAEEKTDEGASDHPVESMEYTHQNELE